MASTSSDQLLEEALKLSDKERARLAHALVASLDGQQDEDVDAAWAEEIKLRQRQVESGEVELRDWADVRERLWRRIGR